MMPQSRVHLFMLDIAPRAEGEEGRCALAPWGLETANGRTKVACIWVFEGRSRFSPPPCGKMF